MASDCRSPTSKLKARCTLRDRTNTLLSLESSTVLPRPFGVGPPKRLAPDPLRTEPLTSNTTKSAGTKDEHLGHTVCPECTVLRHEGLYGCWVNQGIRSKDRTVILGPKYGNRTVGRP